VHLQGLTYTDAPHEQPDAWAALQSDNTATKLPGGESLDELRERLTAAVLDVARTHPGVLGGHTVVNGAADSCSLLSKVCISYKCSRS
jgi:broad specificity phosphatase PhoE